MATSRSSSENGWIAGASVFSGRHDPTWPIPTKIVEQLERIWDSLARWEGPLPSPPALGYRGCFVRGTAGRTWTAFGGAVTQSRNGSSESRRDDVRAFELTTLASAPEGTLPPSLAA
jgi:hypothetical protein